MNTEGRNLLEEILEELRQLRQAVERIETRGGSTPVKVPKRGLPPELSEAECKKLYAEIGEEYAHGRTTRKLDMLLGLPKSNLSLFCSANHLPISLHNGKAHIRDQILARIREDEQLGATYPMPSREAAYLAERKK